MDESKNTATVDEGLMAAFDALTQVITTYYRFLGLDQPCGKVYAGYALHNPGLGIDYVPSEARELIEELSARNRIILHKDSGPGGFGAHYYFLYEGLTPEKLEELAKALVEKMERSTGPSFERKEVNVKRKLPGLPPRSWK